MTKMFCGVCNFQSDLKTEQKNHMTKDSRHWLSCDSNYSNKYPVSGVADEVIVQRLQETIDFLKVESIGGIWNTPQLISMLEDLFKEKKN